MSNYFIGCLFFADDVTLLCQTMKGVKRWLLFVKIMPHNLMLNVMGRNVNC